LPVLVPHAVIECKRRGVVTNDHNERHVGILQAVCISVRIQKIAAEEQRTPKTVRRCRVKNKSMLAWYFVQPLILHVTSRRECRARRSLHREPGMFPSDCCT